MDKKQFDEIQLCTNETVIELIGVLKDRMNRNDKVTIISMCIMLLNTLIVVGGLLYFCSAFEVEVTDEYTTTQTIEGEGAVINNVDGTNNSVTNNLGGANDGESNSN